MIAYFPSLYPDELIYSLFARYYVKSGYMGYASAAEDLFANKTTHPDIEFINRLSDEVLITLFSSFAKVDVLAEGWWANQVNFGFIDQEMFSECLIGEMSGRVLRCGSDFEPGDYYVFSLWGANALFGVSDAPNDFTYSYERIIRKIHAEKGQYIMLLDAVLVKEEDVDTNNWQKYGVYLVGKDIPAGEYKIETISDRYS